MKQLNERYIRSINIKEKKQVTLSDKGTSGVRGLSIVASYGGAKIFYFRYLSPSGKQIRMRIGEYPQTSLSEARTIAREYRKCLDNGEDPKSKNKRFENKARQYHNIGELWAEYHKQAKSIKKCADFENSLWNKHVASALNNIDLNHFNRDTILDFLIPFRNSHSPALGARIQALISQLGAFAVEQRVAEYSPAYQLGKKKPLPSNDRYLDTHELTTFWNILYDPKLLAQARVSKPLALALVIALSTCARRAEVASMRWRDIDFESQCWTIPASITKNGKLHIVPISPLTREVLGMANKNSRRPGSPFVFPGRRREVMTKGAGHIKPDAITRACSRINKALLSQNLLSEKFSPHDLRRTGATYLASKLKVDRFIISQILNHSSDKGGGSSVTGIYARYDFLEEKKDALDRWSQYLKGLS